MFIHFISIVSKNQLSVSTENNTMWHYICSPVNVQRTVPEQKGQHCAPPDYCPKDSDTQSAAQTTAT